MGTPRPRNRPITVTVDGPPRLSPEAAVALLKLVQHLIELQDQEDGRVDEEAIAS